MTHTFKHLWVKRQGTCVGVIPLDLLEMGPWWSCALTLDWVVGAQFYCSIDTLFDDLWNSHTCTTNNKAFRLLFMRNHRATVWEAAQWLLCELVRWQPEKVYKPVSIPTCAVSLLGRGKKMRRQKKTEVIAQKKSQKSQLPIFMTACTECKLNCLINN